MAEVHGHLPRGYLKERDRPPALRACAGNAAVIPLTAAATTSGRSGWDAVRTGGYNRLSTQARVFISLDAESLLSEPLEAVRECRTFRALVRQLANAQREGFGVARDPKRPRVDGVKAQVADQPGRDLLRGFIVAAV